MGKNKDIIWQMSRDYKPGINEQKFEIILSKNQEEVLPSFKYIAACDPYKVEEPLNFWHKIKMKLGFKYKTKELGWSYTLHKIETVNGKKVIIYDTNR